MSDDKQIEERYSLKEGETIFDVCQLFNISIGKICELNNLEEDNLINLSFKEGDSFKVSEKVLFQRHIVSQGETIEDLALMYETSVSEIKSLNKNLKEELVLGQKVFVSEFPSYFLKGSQAATYCPEGSPPDDCDNCGGGTFFGSNRGDVCDCSGNTIDCNGVCGGSSIFDDCGVCGGSSFLGSQAGDICDCSGTTYKLCDGFLVCENECPIYGCTDSSASNYNPSANRDDGSCCSSSGSNVCGCMDVEACNYNGTATQDDGSCEYDSCYPTPTPGDEGCTDPNCSNYNPSASIDDGSCDCIYGCTDPTATNYNPDANTDDGSCDFSGYGCTDSNACNYNPLATINDGTCEYISCNKTKGCTDNLACNYNPNANEDDGTCMYDDSCGVCGGDNSTCSTPTPEIIYGCLDIEACNYDSSANASDGSCLYYDLCNVCGGYNDCVGCTDDKACDYNSSATIMSSCDYSCYGCMDPEAVNWEPEATHDDGTCLYKILGCLDLSACNYNKDADEDDGSCEYSSCYGCIHSDSCNYNPYATKDDGSCIGSVSGGCYGCKDRGAVNYSAIAVYSDPSVCSYEGCTDSSACNYDSHASQDDGTCDYSCAGCTDGTACNYDSTATQDDGSCEYESCQGCTDSSACNYDSHASQDDGTCDFSCYGCTDPNACNYEPNFIVDDASCDYSCWGCNDIDACNYDPSATIDDGTCDYQSCVGCTNPNACNYDPTATKECLLTGSSPAQTQKKNGAAHDNFGNRGCEPCEYGTCGYCDISDACNYLFGYNSYSNPQPNSSLCHYACYGCADPNASNFDPYSTYDCVDPSICDPCEYDFHTPTATEEPTPTITETPYITPTPTPKDYRCADIHACNYDDNTDLPAKPELCHYFDACDQCLHKDDPEWDNCPGGCMNPDACNYDPSAKRACNLNDGPWECENCVFEPCYVCGDPEACNYYFLHVEGHPSLPEVTIDGKPRNFYGKWIDNSLCDYSCWGCWSRGYANSLVPQGEDVRIVSTGWEGNRVYIWYYLEGDTSGFLGQPKIRKAHGRHNPDLCEPFNAESSCGLPGACNYNPAADPNSPTYDATKVKHDASECDWSSCMGCMNPDACDYDSSATNPGPCKYIEDECGKGDDYCDCDCNTFDACEECGGDAVETDEKDATGSFLIEGGSANECGTCGQPEIDDCNVCVNKTDSPRYRAKDGLYSTKKGDDEGDFCDCDSDLTPDLCGECSGLSGRASACNCAGCKDSDADNYIKPYKYDDDMCPNPHSLCGTYCQYYYTSVTFIPCKSCEELNEGSQTIEVPEVSSTLPNGKPIILSEAYTYEAESDDNIQSRDDGETEFWFFRDPGQKFYKQIRALELENGDLTHEKLWEINGRCGRISMDSSLYFDCKPLHHPDSGFPEPGDTPGGLELSTHASCISCSGCAKEFEDCATKQKLLVAYDEEAPLKHPDTFQLYNNTGSGSNGANPKTLDPFGH